MMPVPSQDGVTARTPGVDLTRCVVVAIDVGKREARPGLRTSSARRCAARSLFAMNRSGVDAMVAAVTEAMPADPIMVRVGVEACGHYHQPVTAAGVLPVSWELVGLNPAWVTAQRRVNGTARRKTDAIDVAAIADLLRAGKGYCQRPCQPPGRRPGTSGLMAI